MIFFKNCLFVCVSLVFYSCLPNRSGCADVMAINYDDKVNRDNSTCVYECKVLIYWEWSTHTTMEFNGVTAVSVFIGEQQLTDKVLLSEYDSFNPADLCESNWPRSTVVAYDSYEHEEIIRVYDQNDSLIIANKYRIVYPNNNYYKDCQPIEIDF